MKTLHKCKNVSTNTASMTIKNNLGRMHVKRRRLIRVEWTTPNELNARAAELDVLADNVLDVT